MASPTSRRHSASLVPTDWHDPALVKLMRSPLTSSMVDDLPSLSHFISTIVKKSRCHVPTLLCTLVYLERLKERLPSHARGCHTTRHRVFLAVLIVAAKYLNDSSPQNKHWVRYAAYFTPAEVNLMERQLLTILNFDLSFTEDELRARLGPLLPRREETVEGRRPYRPLEFVEVNEEACVEVPIRAVGTIASQGRRTTEPAVPTVNVASNYGKRITPEYTERRASSPGPSTSGPLAPHHLSAISMVAHRPPLRAKASNISMASSRGSASRRNSSYMSEGGLSPRSSIDDIRTSYYYSSSASSSNPSPRSRLSRLSSNSSMSTLSSTSSGPQTPYTPYDDQSSSKIPPVPSVPPVSLADYTLAPAPTSTSATHPSSLYPPAPPAASQPKSRYISPLDSSIEAYNPPTPGLMYAMSHDPDLWPLMSASAVSVKDARGTRAARTQVVHVVA
ncbi:PHO85 cyclin-1 [Rhodotorula toruloides]